MRRALRITAWSLGGVLLAVCLVVLGLLMFGNTERGRSSIESLTARLSGGYVQLHGLKGSFPSHLLIDELTLTDDRGVWLTARHIEVSWSPLKYLTAGLSIEQGSIQELSMKRLPHAAPASGPPRGEVK